MQDFRIRSNSRLNPIKISERFQPICNWKFQENVQFVYRLTQDFHKTSRLNFGQKFRVVTNREFAQIFLDNFDFQSNSNCFPSIFM